MISFCTVVYAKEIALLKLQARSFARFAPESLVGEILIAINDRNERRTQRMVQDILPEFGRHQSKVRILTCTDVFQWPSERRSFQDRVRRAKVVFPPLRGTRLDFGWKGNRGWTVQQALKIALADYVRFPFTVILDAKNIWVDDISRETFVTADNRARMNMISRNVGLFKKWFPASARLIAPDLDNSEVETATTYLTPYVIRSDILAGVNERLKDREGSALEAILLTRPHPTEFFMISAYVIDTFGSLEAVFCDGLDGQMAFFRSAESAKIDQVLADLENGGGFTLALHAMSLAQMNPQQETRLARALLALDLVETREEFLGICADLKRNFRLQIFEKRLTEWRRKK